VLAGGFFGAVIFGLVRGAIGFEQVNGGDARQAVGPDLAKLKLIPAIYELAHEKLLPEKFALIGFGRKEISDAEFRTIVQEAVKLVEVEAEKHGVTIALALAPDLRPVMADVIMIEQVLINLIRNAIEAIRDAAADRRLVRIVSAGKQDAVQLTVHDHGQGVAPEAAANLFKPFFSTKADGMGIGLNISRSIVEFHGGRLWHEPAPAGGSLFCFTLPVTTA